MSEAPTGAALTRNEMRELDRKAIEELGIPSVCLMELAGLAVADEAESLCKERRLVVVVADTSATGASKPRSWSSPPRNRLPVTLG